MASMRRRLDSLYDRLEDNRLLLAVRNGILMTIPAVMAGSIALLLISIPLDGYQNALQALWGGALYQIFSVAHGATLGSISLLMLLAISYSYADTTRMSGKEIVPLVSLCAYIAFTMGEDLSIHPTIFQSTWLFYAILVALSSSALFVGLLNRLPFHLKTYADGENALFRQVFATILPAAMVIALAAVLNRLLTTLFGGVDLQTLLSDFNAALFSRIGINLGSGLLFILLMHLMWFFGIHGSNILDNVARSVFEPIVEHNCRQIAAGQVPAEIVSKTFFDTFVLFGGCGTMLCLILAIFLCDRRRSVRKLSKIALVPAVFNMNELMMFGIPVVFNPLYFIPFLLTPLVLTLVSYLATFIGLVPHTIHSVEWTTPIFLSGYVATDSAAGSLLQLFNLALGTCIYIPFVKLSQAYQRRRVKEQIFRLTELVKRAEEEGREPQLTTMTGSPGLTAKGLAADLQEAIRSRSLELYYQPQVNSDGKIVGAEALLRWKHNIAGFLYPPLVIALAKEAGLMDQLDAFIIGQTCDDMERLTADFPRPLQVSLNLTAEQIASPKVIDSILQETGRRRFGASQLGVELTEQAMFNISPASSELLDRLRQAGILVLMDDFGMGHSSMMHLQHHQFDVVKLDGALVRDIETNPRSREIVSSILYLSRSLHFQVLAEYVETTAQRDVLRELGCLIYQGWLYSPALPFEELKEYIRRHEAGDAAEE